LADKNISEIEKKILVEQAKGEAPKDLGMQGPTKRTKLSSFKDRRTYITSER